MSRLRTRVRVRHGKPLADILRAADNTMQDAAERVVELAKRPPPNGSPVDIGNNRDSIAWERLKKLVWRVFTASNYGAYLEFGTSRMPARPYFGPSIVQMIKEYQSTRKWAK